MAEVNLDNICIKNLKEFSERLNENRKKSDQIESLETKTLYKLFLNIGEEVMNSYELAYQKCKEDIVAGKENYEGGFEDIEKKMEQNNELVREIKIEKKNWIAMLACAVILTTGSGILSGCSATKENSQLQQKTDSNETGLNASDEESKVSSQQFSKQIVQKNKLE